MRNNSTSRFVVLFAVAMLASYLRGNTIRWDCFEVASGYMPHIVCTFEYSRTTKDDGIPATSFAAGANPIGSAISEDYNYQGGTRPNGWPRSENEWQHSDILKIAYFYVYDFFDKLKRQ